MIASREFVIKKLAELIADPKKKYSQNFLTDADVVRGTVAILSEASVEEVVEIGPGLGALSEEVLAQGYRLRAYEIDPIMCGHLKQQFRHAKAFCLCEGDFMKCDLKKDCGGRPVAVLSNLPYHLTTPIIEKVLTSGADVRLFVFMIQKEVSGRLSAACGTKEFGPLTLFLQYLGSLRPVVKVTRDKFIPTPGVDSLVMALKITKERDPVFEDFFYRLLTGCFAMRRKTVLNNLSAYLCDKERAASALRKAELSESLRPEQIPLEGYLSLARALTDETESF